MIDGRGLNFIVCSDFAITSLAARGLIELRMQALTGLGQWVMGDGSVWVSLYL